MRVTVCELKNNPAGLDEDWHELVEHVHEHHSDLVLLPEMPFYPWLAADRAVDGDLWQKAVDAHDQWLERLPDLSPAWVGGTRAILARGKRLNEGFIYQPQPDKYQAVHTKTFLPDEPGFWEASWYDRGPVEFKPVTLRNLKLGYLICTEIWFAEHARHYGQQGSHLLLCPRATPLSTLGKWIAGGRTAAVVSGTYCLSSNLGGGVRIPSHTWGGGGWIIDPEGDVLGITDKDHPFLTLEINLQIANDAKKTYPRYVQE